MTRAKLSLALTFLSVIPAVAQNIVTNWYPLRPGTTWTYQNEFRDGITGGIAHPEITRWQTEETIVGSGTVPEGLLVWSRIRALDPTPTLFPAWKKTNAAYLIRDQCMFVLDEQDWQPSDHQLTTGFRRSLAAGEISADYCFPLTLGKTWGAPHWGGWRKPADAKDWKVVRANLHNPSAPDRGKAFHIISVSSYLGSGMTEEIWFEKGVGIVREQDIHHGTYEENRMHLIHFQPGPE